MIAQTLKAVAATGQLGTGFKGETLAEAARGASFIGCDAGSTDPGPYYLGSGETQAADAALERDLELIIEQALEHNIPAMIGSAGTGGGTPHLAHTRAIVEGIARKRKWRFSLAAIDSEIPPAAVAEALRRGRLRPLEGAPELDAAGVLSATRFVAMQGVEPFQEALRGGAQVILSGRCTDVSLYAALPLTAGVPPGVAYHAGKLLECGAAIAEQRSYPDAMAAWLDDAGFLVEPPNPTMRCTPQSVASHGMYECADPFLHVEPGGTLDLTNCTYEAVSDRAVRVAGGTFNSTPRPTIRLEGARLVGYRTVVVAGIRDPLVLGQLNDFLDSADAVIRDKIAHSLSLAPNDYRIKWRVYGRDGTLGELEPNQSVTGHEIGLLIDIVADTQQLASSIGSVAWHTALHHPIPEYSGLVSHLAFPFSPPGLDAGAVYSFCINHVIDLADLHDLDCLPKPVFAAIS
jgi:hypothetical protein